MKKRILYGTLFLYVIFVMIYVSYQDSLNYTITDIESPNLVNEYTGLEDYKLLDTFKTSHSKMCLIKIDDKLYIQVLFKKYFLSSKYKLDSTLLLPEGDKRAYIVKDFWNKYEYRILNEKIIINSKKGFVELNLMNIFAFILLMIAAAIKIKEITSKKANVKAGNMV